MKKLEQLKKELQQTKDKLANAGYIKAQFLIEDEDEYQSQLELQWYKDELRDEIDALENQIRILETPVNQTRTVYPTSRAM